MGEKYGLNLYLLKYHYYIKLHWKNGNWEILDSWSCDECLHKTSSQFNLLPNKNREDMKAIRLNGQVQGVFLRKNTREKAEYLNVNGFVRNESNGSVYIEAEGDKVDDLIDWLKSNPGDARVENVETEELPDKGYERFEIR